MLDVPRLRFFLAALLWTCMSLAVAQDVTRQAELEDMQQRIRELEHEIERNRTAHAKASSGVAEAERAVSQSRRTLRELAERVATAEKELAEREAEHARVDARIAQRRAELAETLRRHYMHRGNEVAPFLSGRDPNQIMRDAHYLERLGQARLEQIDALRADLAEQERLLKELAEQRVALGELESAQKREQAKLEKVHAARAKAQAQLAGELHAQERAIKAMRENEQQLSRVVELAQRSAQQQRNAPAAQGTPTGPVASATTSGKPFAQLRGQLGFPVEGELAARFGAPRQEGGMRWRGLFIRAAGGAQVRTVAAGTVVFSDWMRGYGNLIIVDHGADYLSIYANNDALLRVVGESVEAGMPIANVGASGGGWETGLYFEVRHNGEPFDPLPWMRRGG